MTRFALFLVLPLVAALTTLSGCVTVPPTQRAAMSLPPHVDPQRLATDAVQQLVALYAPAQTRLELHHPAADPFGQSLMPLLRDKGYAVRDFVATESTGPAAEATGRESALPAGLPLRYVLDQAGAADLYRLTLTVGAQSLSRPYQLKNGAWVPAGYWVRKE